MSESGIHGKRQRWPSSSEANRKETDIPSPHPETSGLKRIDGEPVREPSVQQVHPPLAEVLRALVNVPQ